MSITCKKIQAVKRVTYSVCMSYDTTVIWPWTTLLLRIQNEIDSSDKIIVHTSHVTYVYLLEFCTYHKPNMPGWSWRGIEHPFFKINTANVKNGHSNMDTCVAGALE